MVFSDLPTWDFSVQQIPLKDLWKIHGGASAVKPVGVVSFSGDGFVGFGEVAEATGSGQMAVYQNEFQGLIDGGLADWSSFAQKEMVSPALRFGIDSAWTHWSAAREGKTLKQWLGTQGPKKVPTSFSVPIMEEADIASYLERHDVQRFQSLKVKVDGRSGVSALKSIARFYKGPLRVDANQGFSCEKEVLAFLNETKKLPLEFLEQPLDRQNVDGYRQLKKLSPLPIVGDESIQDQEITDFEAQQFHGINIKLMKSGSYKKAIQQIQQARKWGLKVMVGCMVESSLGIAGALSLGKDVDWWDLDGFLLLSADPFGFVKESQGFLSVVKDPASAIVE